MTTKENFETASTYAHEAALADALRPFVARNGSLRVVTTEEAGPDGQDRGNLWAIVTSGGDVIISDDDSLPNPPGAAVPYGVVSWESGTVTEVPLSHIDATHLNHSQ